MTKSVELSVKMGSLELPFNIYEANTAAAYELALQELKKKKPEPVGLSELIENEVGAVRRFLDVLFGEGVAQEVLGEVDDLNAALRCVEAVTEAAAAQGEAMRSRIAAYTR